ncbi:triple tyrosine motif-containing protein [Pedobacter cryotolerans]|uniref:Transcriptional regulator n=1 Tax=Pedobacter cryotolerans TaxID=2571270 RepID=A0A4U1C0D9_9SPHI|nr:triple tyrosine motif-containing protein [Pedobacter cryotolerans]TKB98344.1 transcriptional regulator [Pedobacter cryotolerans]
MRYLYFLFLYLFLSIVSVKAQGPIGLPQVSSFSNLQYRGGTQNWGITQDKNGILYFANNEGLITYNGAYWKSYLLPNKTVVRSVKISADGKIYVGGQDELGYFFPNESGTLIFHSIKNLIPAGERQFADIWDIHLLNDEIFFRTVNKIFRLKNNKIDVFITRNAWVYAGVVNKEILAHENKIGLKHFKNGQWLIKCDDKRILNSTITAILPYSADTLLITTLKDGLFLLKGNKLIEKRTINDRVFANDRINCALRINENLYALGTTSSALLVINKQGVIERQFSYAEGLNNNNIRSVLLDQHQNLWLGLDDGISFIAFNSAIKHIYPDRNKQVSSYATKIFNSKLYIGTSNGLLAAPIDLNAEDFSNLQTKFTEVENSKGQTWGLTEVNKHLLLANEDGGYVVNNYSASQLYSGLGTWLFASLSKNNQDDYVVAGTYTGLELIDYKNGTFSTKGTLSALNEPLRFIAVDHQLNCVWASHPYRGIYKLDISADRQKIIKTTLLTKNDGLPKTLYNYIFKIKGKIVAATADGIYQYDAAIKRFYQSALFRPMFKNLSIQLLTEDKDGNVWFVSEKRVGVIDFKQKNDIKNFTIVEFPELTAKILAGFENIYPYNDRNIFIGANKGLIHIDYRKYAANIYKPNVLLGQIKIIGKTDSIFFGGYYSKEKNETKKLSYEFNSMHFEYASTLFEQKENIEYSYQLKGYDDEWSTWSSKSEKDYTNLPHGKYTFFVKARNNLGNESEPTSYSFAISAPWYNSNLAYVFYFLVFSCLVYLLIKLQEKEHLRQQDKLRQKHQLEIERNEQQITKLQKKQLEADVEFKNKELATTTMHLVQRGKLLSKIGDELLPLMQETTSKDTANDLKKVIRLLNEAKKLDNDWNQFAIHFDHVHANFLTNLKVNFPNLSPSDLKLCAYLKLNLSSKEIAQLLNITPRAVEVSRYRLRKKLGLKPEVNLFDYLLNNAVKIT